MTAIELIGYASSLSMGSMAGIATTMWLRLNRLRTQLREVADVVDDQRRVLVMMHDYNRMVEENFDRIEKRVASIEAQRGGPYR